MTLYSDIQTDIAVHVTEYCSNKIQKQLVKLSTPDEEESVVIKKQLIYPTNFSVSNPSDEMHSSQLKILQFSLGRGQFKFIRNNAIQN